LVVFINKPQNQLLIKLNKKRTLLMIEIEIFYWLGKKCIVMKGYFFIWDTIL
jgi:hypothetical protein